ncbi:alpha/beta fold hydrolase [Novosphingobium sp. AP12]|uniref:alpha/beta fold hydrolase n=1 Tax=Novosphingobium sp. AP12 TaxID=1144305 RepID=UPI0002722459|nr:alpha/beta hydrolase [Novosphingobium sp. AP12]EJL23634.1 putative hydrolase or acyltransferase of alpha/beta superfamily [Novosphingobium sp. AP12]
MRAPAMLARLGAVVAAGLAAPALADPMLADFSYGWPVEHHSFESQRERMEMAYLDVRPDRPNGRTAVLLHGKNFCAGSWDTTIRALSQAGYRVIAPDQIGFCKSTKPARYQYGLHTLAANTHELLAALRIEKPVLIGHSMGGMLAMRYALQYPGELSKLVLVNPLGLEDWRAKGVPNATVDQLYVTELKATRASIKAYQQSTYYAGQWRPDYDRWVDMLASMYAGPGGEVVAWHQALTADMVFNQPVIHEIDRIAVPTVLMIGEKDNTAIGKNRADKALQARLGDYPRLAREAAARIPGARLVTYPAFGHSPQVQGAGQFNADLLEALR